MNALDISSNKVIDLFPSIDGKYIALMELVEEYELRQPWMNVAQLPGKINPAEMTSQFRMTGENDCNIVYVCGNIAVIYSKIFNHTTYHPTFFSGHDELGQTIDTVA